MVSRDEITKERMQYLLTKANELAEAMKCDVDADIFPITSVSVQKYGICIAREQTDNLEVPIRASLYTHINFDVSDEYLNDCINAWKDEG